MVFSWQTFNKNISSDGEKKRAAEEYLEMPWNTHVFAFSKPETNRSHTLLVAAWELCCTSMASAVTDPPTIARSYSGSIPLPPWPRCALPVLNAGSFRATKSRSSPLGFRHQTRSTTFDLLPLTYSSMSWQMPRQCRQWRWSSRNSWSHHYHAWGLHAMPPNNSTMRPFASIDV